MQKRRRMRIFGYLDFDHFSLKRIPIFALLLLALTLADQASGDIRESLERIYDQQALQTELSSDDFRGFERLFEWMGANGQLLGYILLVLGLVAVLVLLVVFLDSRNPVFFRNRESAADKGSESGPSGGVQTESVYALLADADALANSGRCGEAIHELLVGLLNWLRRDTGIEWQPAQTAREIAADRDSAGTLGLWDLVRASEQAYFGGYDAGPESYSACRESFSRIVSEVSLKGKRA